MNLIVFDMDGVLVDVSSSYREATREAAYIFLRDVAGLENLPHPLLSLEKLAEIKQLGGLNNDWDMTHKVASLFSAEADKYYKGDIGSGNVIKQIFQEIYLGEELFRSTYGIDAAYCHSDGLILKEKLFTSKALLTSIAVGNTLAIATGRPGSEAAYPLKKHGLDMFRTVISYDDCILEEGRIYKETGKCVSLSKPSPFMLDKIASMYPDAEKLYYCGDVGDDMRAAKSSRYPYIAVGIAYSAPDEDAGKKALLKCGADMIIDTPEQLARIGGEK